MTGLKSILSSVHTLTLEFDRGHQVLVSGDGVNAPPLPQVPHFTCVVTAPRGHMKAAADTHTDRQTHVLLFWKELKMRISEHT